MIKRPYSWRLSALASLLLALLNQACSTAVQVPSNRFESPEASGGLGHGSLEGNMSGTNEIVIQHSVLDDNWKPIYDDPALNRSYTMGFGAKLGLLEFVDIGAETPGIVKAKVQLIGAPKTKMGSGQFSAAVTGSAGRWKGSGIGLDFTTFTPDRTDMFDASAVLGQRINRHFLIYGGPFYSQYNYQNTFLSEPVYRGRIQQRGLHAGLEFNVENYCLMVEGTTTQVISGRLNKRTYHAGFEYSFVF